MIPEPKCCNNYSQVRTPSEAVWNRSLIGKHLYVNIGVGEEKWIMPCVVTGEEWGEHKIKKVRVSPRDDGFLAKSYVGKGGSYLPPTAWVSRSKIHGFVMDERAREAARAAGYDGV